MCFDIIFPYILNLSAVGRAASFSTSAMSGIYAVVISVASVSVVILLKRFQTMKNILKERNDAMKAIKSQNAALMRREENITDSLIYAQRIQEARLPSEEYFRTHFPSSFVLFKPRNIVSGDFYWIGEKNEWIYVVAADCTGHGVSGALMSMIGIDILERTINENRVMLPSAILTRLDEALENTLNSRKNPDAVIADGMDIGLCAINKDSRKMVYSGAFFNMYLFRDNSLMQINGNKIVIGMNPDRDSYTDHEIDIEDDDILYLFSDGYIDQFGGNDNKKFMCRRLRYLLLNIHKFNVDDQKSILDENFKTWMGDNQQVDDVMIVGLKPL